jgi:hypothetical protein
MATDRLARLNLASTGAGVSSFRASDIDESSRWHDALPKLFIKACEAAVRK